MKNQADPGNPRNLKSIKNAINIFSLCEEEGFIRYSSFHFIKKGFVLRCQSPVKGSAGILKNP
jgi:hypothetical protein